MFGLAQGYTFSLGFTHKPTAKNASCIFLVALLPGKPPHFVFGVLPSLRLDCSKVYPRASPPINPCPSIFASPGWFEYRSSAYLLHTPQGCVLPLAKHTGEYNRWRGCGAWDATRRLSRVRSTTLSITEKPLRKRNEARCRMELSNWNLALCHGDVIG